MSVYGECLRKAMEDIEANPGRRLVMGPPGYPGQTAHFWTEDDEYWYDRAANTVPKTYVRRGRVVDPASVVAELRKAGVDI